MTRRNTKRRAEILNLAAMGVKVVEIAKRLGVSRQTVYRHLREVDPATVSGDRNGHIPVTPSDFPAMREEGFDMLRQRASEGHVTAAAALTRLAATEARLDACSDHVASAVVGDLLVGQHELWKSSLLGPFARRMSLELELDAAVVEEYIQCAIDDVTNEMNQTAGAAKAASE